jgi:kynurenine formamidase
MATIRQKALSRRDALAWTAAAGVAGVAGLKASSARAQQASPVPVASPLPGGFSQIVDLSHVWGPEFPVFPGAQQPQFDVLVTIETGGFFKYQLTLDEHTGTHMDAPLHFDVDGIGADAIPVEQLIAPLAVVDISARAASDIDAQGMVDDVLVWEETHGPLPPGAFVALNSGWDAKVNDPAAYLNVDAEGLPHFPGWHPEAAAFLVEERDIVGVGVDTVSLDFGASTDFGTHVTVLTSGRYGVENLASLGNVPAVGATIVVGGPKHLGASGGPTRALALV